VLGHREHPLERSIASPAQLLSLRVVLTSLSTAIAIAARPMPTIVAIDVRVEAGWLVDNNRVVEEMEKSLSAVIAT
jgi:hypothetical protein